MKKDIEQNVALAKQGSHKDIELVFKAFKGSIEACAYKLRTRSFDFEDAVQEGNIGLFKAILSYCPSSEASFSTYAKKCILNNILSALKSSQSQKHQVLNNAKPLDEDMWLHNPETDMLIKEQNRELISTAKEKLSKFEFLVFNLYTMQYSYLEIAQMTDKDEKSINNAVQRIHKKLRK
ncbi:MAG: sigma-70 family RNA polymerase sigma factor [Oscillospiraceae bacterium]